MLTTKHAFISPRVAEYIRLHQNGVSTAALAKQFDAKKNSVIQALRYQKALRQTGGRDVEMEVAAWTSQFANSCYRFRGDHPFDLLVDGRRVDVKSAHLCRGRYYFEITHNGVNKDYRSKVDQFYLVCLDAPGIPVYRVETKSVHVIKMLTVPAQPERSKYPLQFLGHLERTY